MRGVWQELSPPLSGRALLEYMIPSSLLLTRLVSLNAANEHGFQANHPEKSGGSCKIHSRKISFVNITFQDFYFPFWQEICCISPAAPLLGQVISDEKNLAWKRCPAKTANSEDSPFFLILLVSFPICTCLWKLNILCGFPPDYADVPPHTECEFALQGTWQSASALLTLCRRTSQVTNHFDSINLIRLFHLDVLYTRVWHSELQQFPHPEELNFSCSAGRSCVRHLRLKKEEDSFEQLPC